MCVDATMLGEKIPAYSDILFLALNLIETPLTFLQIEQTQIRHLSLQSLFVRVPI